ncbi:MAG: hypothetical protein QM446_01550, partial [Synergistota bacterium]|nr:hypothetical protein [Synergistota bacterium]
MAQFIPFTPEEQEEYKKKAGLLPSTGVVEPPEPKRATGSFVPLEPEERKGILADRLVLAAREGYEEQPEDYARRLQLARSNGWPEWMVSDPEIRKEAELNELGRKLTELPEDYSRTSSVLGIPKNFTLFRDDIETLKGVEDAVKGASAVTPMGRATVAFDEPGKDPVAEFFSHSGKGFANVMELHRYAELSAKERTEGLAGAERAEWDALQSRLVPEEAPTLWEQVQQGAGSSLAFQVRPLSRFLSRWGIPLALATAGAAALAGTGGTAAPLIGALTPAAKALALGGAIGATGYRVQSFMDYQGLATELSYRTLSQMTDDRGVPYAEILGEGTISRLARGIGLASSTMESVGLEAVLGMVPGIGSLIPAKGMTRSVLMQPTIQKAILTGLANAFRTWSVEVGTEVAEQAVTTGGEEFAKWMVEQSGGRVSYADAGEWAARLGEEAVGAGAAFLLGVGVGPGMMNVAGNVAQVNAAKRAQKTFLTLVELAEQSRGFKRSPDDGASVVSGIVAGSPVETTYVAARQFVEAYQQLGVDPAAVAESLGVSRESLAEALETEGRIAVPTGEWTAKVAGTEAGRALLGDLTFESDGMTLREAQVAERELTELMRREAKAAEEAFKADELLNQELESVRTDFLTQATGAGLDAETAQADAEVWAAFARTAYRRFGNRPREFSDMVGLEIRQGREVAAGEEALYQTAFHGSPYRFSRFSLDHVGEGEGAQAFGWGLYFAGSKDVAEWYRSRLQNGSPVIKNDDVTYMETNDGWRFSSDQSSDDWLEFNVNIPEVQAEVDGLDLFRDFGYDQKAAEEAIDQALRHPEAVSNATLGDILDSREGRAR